MKLEKKGKNLQGPKQHCLSPHCMESYEELSMVALFVQVTF
jgi:hypothetical protein